MGEESWWHLATVVALIMALGAAVLAAGLARLLARFPGVAQPPPSPGLPIGSRIHPVTLARLGSSVPETLLSDLRDRIVLFVTPTCSACKELTPGLQPFVEQGARQWEVVVIMCGPQLPAEAYATTLIDEKVRVLLDPDGRAEAAFETLHFFPFGFEVSAEGRIRARGSANTWGQVHRLAADGALYGTPARRPAPGNRAVELPPLVAKR